METWILMVWLTAQPVAGQRQISVPTPILWDFSSKDECQLSAAEFIASGSEQLQKQAIQSFERYGYAGDMDRGYRCIRGPRR